MTTRRAILKTMGAAGALSLWDAPIRFAFASVPTDRRFVVVILRGALDGLAAVPPHGDADYASVRGQLALDKTGASAVHDLDGFFGLHPSLSNMKTLFDARELTVLHSSPPTRVWIPVKPSTQAIGVGHSSPPTSVRVAAGSIASLVRGRPPLGKSPSSMTRRLTLVATSERPPSELP